MSQRRSSRLQQLDEGSSPAKNNEKNSNKSTPKRGKNSQSEKETPKSKEKKSLTDEKNPREAAKNNRRKSDQKTNATNISTDKSTNDTPKRGQKRKAPSDANEGPKNKKQKTANLSEEYDDVPFEESSSSQRRRSGKSVDEKVDEILDMRAEQWHQIDQYELEGSENTGGEDKMVVYNSLTDADVNSPSSQQKLARTTAVVNSKGKKVQFNAYSDLLSGDKDDLSFLTADDRNEDYEKEDKKEQYFRNLKARLALMTEEEQKAEVRRLYYEALQRKAKKRGLNYPLQSTPIVKDKARKAPKTAPVMRTNVLRNPTSPTKFSATKDKKTTTDESRNNTNKNKDMQVVGEENGSPRKSAKATAAAVTPNKTKSTSTTPKKGSDTPKSATKATPSKKKSTPAKTPAKMATKVTTSAKSTPKNTPSKSKGTNTPSKAKSTPNKASSATPSKAATLSKKASPKKNAAKPTRARARPTRFSL